MRFFIALFLAVLVFFLGAQCYRLIKQRSDYAQQAAALKKQNDELSTENAQLSRDIQFYQNPTNATKELQSKVNYKKPDEQLIILVPASSTE